MNETDKAPSPSPLHRLAHVIARPERFRGDSAALDAANAEDPTLADLERAAGELFRLLEAGKLVARVGGRWPLAEAGAAQEALAARRTTGSLLLLP